MPRNSKERPRVHSSRDQDKGKGATEQDENHRGGNTSMQGQLGYRDQDADCRIQTLGRFRVTFVFYNKGDFSNFLSCSLDVLMDCGSEFLNRRLKAIRVFHGNHLVG